MSMHSNEKGRRPILLAPPRLKGTAKQPGRRPVFTGRGPEAAFAVQELALRLVVWCEAVGRLRVVQIIVKAVMRPSYLFKYVSGILSNKRTARFQGRPQL